MKTLRGRDAASTTLRAALGSAMDGRGVVVSISGDAGIGKSALATNLAEAAEAAGASVTWGRAWEFADAPPYFPFAPCLRALGVDAPRASRDESLAFQQWEVVLEALATAAAKKPIVWVLEDLHAADLGSLDLLTFLAQPVCALRVLVVATIRSPDPRLGDRKMQRLTRIARDGIDIRLAPLSDEDVAALTEETIGRAVAKPQLARLMDLTRGNPLFVVECARAFRSAGGIEGTLGSLPSTVRQILVERIEALPKDTRDALASGAVLGREFSAAMVASMNRMLPARAIDALLPAIRVGIVEEPKPGRFSFTHAFVRDAIEETLANDDRAERHIRAEAALATLDPTADVLVERARHAMSALRGADTSAQEHALGLTSRALALLEREGAFDRAFDLGTRRSRHAHRRRARSGASSPRQALRGARHGAHRTCRRPIGCLCRVVRCARGEVARGGGDGCGDVRARGVASNLGRAP